MFGQSSIMDGNEMLKIICIKKTPSIVNEYKEDSRVFNGRQLMTSVQSASAGSGKNPVFFRFLIFQQFYINFMTVS